MAQTNLIGKNILGYTVSEKLGSGAFGTVYTAPIAIQRSVYQPRSCG